MNSGISGDELRARIQRLGLTYTRAAERLGLTLDGLNKQMRGDNPVSRQTAIILTMLENLPRLSQAGRWEAERQMEQLRKPPADQEFGLDGEVL
jgi:hypothetical protein